jgi:hypothetical protein
LRSVGSCAASAVRSPISPWTSWEEFPAVFTIAVEEWTSEPERGLTRSIQTALNDLRAALGSERQRTGLLESRSG